jgi:uncharacterized protein (DUF1800 family)
MLSDTQPSDPTRLRTGAKSFLSIFLSIAFVFPTGIGLPAPVAAVSAREDGHDSAFPLHGKNKKSKQDPALKGLPITELSADEAILHALNRLAYGPRPGDVERLRQMGLVKWIEQQLNPNAIEDRAVQARLEQFPTLRMSTAKLLAEYPQPKQQEKQAAGTEARLEQRRSDAAEATIARDISDKGAQRALEQSPAGHGAKSMKDNTRAAWPMNQETALEKNAATRGMAKPDLLGGGDPNAVPRAIAGYGKRPQRVVEELAMAKVARAIYSEWQLQQVMDDFWFNHFNVFAGKGEDRWFLTSYERDVIQPHAMGKFKDLLTATARSPAMLFYLDNFLSADPRAAERIAAERASRQRRRGEFGRPWPPRAPQQQQAKMNVRGLNENYGRELMELHTLGVDGGYTQKDVTEVARCFTGWTIEKPREDADFKFDERLHDPDPKMVLGNKINSGGMKDGEKVIELLVRHPSTAKFISTKLARRFVSDSPPQLLVAQMANTFESSDGNIRAVLKTMIYSPEFWSREAYQTKIKTPFELVVSTARALGSDVDTPMPLVQWTGRIGEPLYQCQPPTGYADRSDAWVNTGALLNRLNFSLALAGNKVRGSRSDVGSLLGPEADSDAKGALHRAVEVFLGGQAGTTTVETLEQQLENPEILQVKLDDPVKRVDLGVVAGLVLGAPEFQRR